MIKLAVIDFCETIANFQTLDPFLELALRNERPWKYKILCNKPTKHLLNIFNRILSHLGYRHILRKQLMILALKNVSEKKLNEYGLRYYVERIKPCLIRETIELIERFKRDGYMTVIVSGGSSFYIKHFAQEYKIDGIISAEIEIKDGKCTGRLFRECLQSEKVEMLNEYIQGNRLAVSEKICITDSKFDLPLLNECDRKIVISHKAHSEWVTKNMEEIIWE